MPFVGFAVSHLQVMGILIWSRFDVLGIVSHYDRV